MEFTRGGNVLAAHIGSRFCTYLNMKKRDELVVDLIDAACHSMPLVYNYALCGVLRYTEIEDIQPRRCRDLLRC
jgi:hypothetical protein